MSLVGCSPLLRVGHDWATSRSPFTFMHWRRKWQPTPVFLPGESQGGGSVWLAVYGVAQSWTRLKQFRSSSSSLAQIRTRVQRGYKCGNSPPVLPSHSWRIDSPPVVPSTGNLYWGSKLWTRDSISSDKMTHFSLCSNRAVRGVYYKEISKTCQLP